MTVIEPKKCKETIFKDLKNGTVFLYARYGVVCIISKFQLSET